MAKSDALSKAQIALHDYMRQYQAEYNRAPTMAEMVAGVHGLGGRPSVLYSLRRLHQRGLISMLDQWSRKYVAKGRISERERRPRQAQPSIPVIEL